MKLRNWIIGSIVAGSIILCVIGGVGYNYVTTLNKELDTYVLPHTTFEGVSLDGKTKQEVNEIIEQHVNQLQEQTITYKLQNESTTFTWEDLGVQYKEADIVDQIFDEQKGSLSERYNLRKKAETEGLHRDFQLHPYLDTAKYNEFIQDKYNEALSNPKDAAISIVGTTISITPSEDGAKVDKEQLKTLTEQAISSANQNIQVPVVAIQPERTTEDIESMGVKEIIAEYRTPMSGRNGSQIYNVDRAAKSLTDVFIAPGEVFSFNDRVGVTNAANGYKTAAIYLNGKVEQSAGGGVCQVSSTLYGAILRADLAIVERRSHSLPVHYVPLGQDATVADYGPDFKFKNDTGHYIYIQSFVDNNQTVVRVFGTNTGKNVHVSSQVVSETDKNIVVYTYKTVTQNGQVIQNGRIAKSTYKKASA